MNFKTTTYFLILLLAATGCAKVTFTPLDENNFGSAIPGIELPEVDGDIFPENPVVAEPVDTLPTNSNYRQVTEAISVHGNNKIDILFVVDNSPSMEYEQKSMAQRTVNFLNGLKDLDWQISVTTTEAYDSNYGDGTILSMKGDSSIKILTSKMNEAQSRVLLSNTLQRNKKDDFNPSPLEQGIYATYRVIERALKGQAVNRDFIRTDSHFAVVLISDEDESRNKDKNKSANLVNLVKSNYNSQKGFTFHSIISRPGDVACLGTHGYSYGHRYQELSQLTGGSIGDVCAMDYAQQVKDIAQGVRDTLKSVTLQCSPVDGKVIVRKGSVVLNEKYEIRGRSIVFANILQAGNYSFEYVCKP